MSVGQLTTQSIHAVHLLAKTAGFPAPGGRIFNLRPTLSRPDLAKMNPAASPAMKEPAEIRKRRRSEDGIFSGFAGENEMHSFGHVVNRVFFDINTSGGTDRDTFSAMDTISGNFQTEYTETGKYTEHCSDRAEYRTENPLFPNGKHDNQKKNYGAAQRK